MIRELKKLPYVYNYLEPIMSQETLEYHYGKHHQAYVTKLNELQTGTEFENMPLEEVIKSSSGAIFNNAAQIWNHDTFWDSLTSCDISLETFHGEKASHIFHLIEKNFGSVESFQELFKKEALGRFGSGWTWLVQEGEKLRIYSSANAENPLTLGGNMLLGLDIWEHSYYIDYRNDRAKFVDNFWKIIHWERVASRIK